MSKDDELPKLPNRYKQGNLFERIGGALDKPDGGTIRSAMRAELASRLKEQRALTTKGLIVRENRRGTLKRMPGGVGGTAANAAYLSRLESPCPVYAFRRNVILRSLDIVPPERNRVSPLFFYKDSVYTGRSRAALYYTASNRQEAKLWEPISIALS